MLLNLSWRNIWRNKLRSLVVISAVAVGSWAVIFMSSFSTGLVQSYIENSIQHEVSHIQIHHPDFLKDKEIEFKLKDTEALISKIRADENVEAATLRTLTNAMVSSSKAARGIQIKAIDPIPEAAVTKLDELVVDGDYLSEEKKNPILISKKIAEKLQVRVRSKIVLTFQDYNTEIVAGAFRVVGIFESDNMPFDLANCFIRRSDLNKLMGVPAAVNIAPVAIESDEVAPPPKPDMAAAHEVAIYFKNAGNIAEITTAYEAKFPKLSVRNYRKISPDVELMESQITISTIIFMSIVMLALVFGIINTMLMAVLERYKELGVLMAIGMNKSKVYVMIVLETLMLAAVAAPIGLLLGFVSVAFFRDKGIDLSAFSAGMREFGMSEIVYPAMNPSLYIQLVIAVAITALLASLYPAWKAIRLKPVEAIRKL